MQIGRRKEIRKLTFRALAIRGSESSLLGLLAKIKYSICSYQLKDVRAKLFLILIFFLKILPLKDDQLGMSEM